MASTVRIDGSLPALGASPTIGTVFAGAWAVDYDWQADRVLASRQPRRLVDIGFPPPFDRDLEGALRGQREYTGFLYLFKDGQYLKLREADMTPMQKALPTAPAWKLPASWTSFDAVFPGGGAKSGFAYFLRGDKYLRFDWSKKGPSAGYPRMIGPHWHTKAPFTSSIDGVIVGQASFDTKAYLFKTVDTTVSTGQTVPVPVYARYDFDTGVVDHTVVDPRVVITNWNGLLPLLDAGAAADLALGWCAGALTALGVKATSLAGGFPSAAATDAAFGHHFMTTTPDFGRVTRGIARMTEIHTRIGAIPNGFSWDPGVPIARTTPNVRTDIGNDFSAWLGPYGRAGMQIQQAGLFIQRGPAFDVREWQGATINGRFFPPPPGEPAYHTISHDNALNNPSSYGAFAQEIAFGADTRFGLARGHE